MLEARKLNLTTVFQLKGYNHDDCHAKLYVNKGTEGIDEIWQATDYGDGQSCLHVHGPCKASHFHDYNRSLGNRRDRRTGRPGDSSVD